MEKPWFSSKEVLLMTGVKRSAKKMLSRDGYCFNGLASSHLFENDPAEIKVQIMFRVALRLL